MASAAAIDFASTSSFVPEPTPAQGALDSAGVGITGGYTGNAIDLKIVIALLLGLSLYNALELLVLVFVTFQRFSGLYFWSLTISAFGILPYSFGFLIKFFQLLNPNESQGYVAVVLLTIGWWTMVTGQSVVLWSRLHLLTDSRRTLRWTLYMIIIDACVLHTTTTVLTFGSNANSLSHATLARFVKGYSIMEKIQMVGFFIQECILSVVYIKEAVRLIKLSESVPDEVRSIDDGSTRSQLRNSTMRKTMYQLLSINVLTISMDIALLGVEFANLYLIETTLKGVVYSVKLKLEFAVLGKLVQIVQVRNNSTSSEKKSRFIPHALERRGTTTTGGPALEKTDSRGTIGQNDHFYMRSLSYDFGNPNLPDFVDPRRVSPDVTHPEQRTDSENGWETRAREDRERWRRRSKIRRGSWIDEEMDKYNIG